MKRRLVCAALAVFALSMPAGAQGYGPGARPGGLPPHEILTILRSTGYDPLGQPVRRGANYVLRALDDDDREVTVVVSARSGEVLSVTPIESATRIPPNGGISMGPYERMPHGWVPGSGRPESYRPPPPGGYRAGAPIVDDDESDPDAPQQPRALPGPPRPRSSVAARPLPPPGGEAQPGGDASPSGPHVITADPDRGGLLPPPPERFPQRVAPQTPPKPKPVTRAAAAPPKQAPLPKPKPSAGPAPAGDIGMPAAAPPIVPEPAQRKSSGADDTPH